MFAIEYSVFLFDLPDIIAYPWNFLLICYGGTQVLPLDNVAIWSSYQFKKKKKYSVSNSISLVKLFSSPSTLPLLVIFAALYFTDDISRHELKLKTDTRMASAFNF